MLESLKIENIAVIESAEIEFESGFNVLTGETGAGKSIIIDSLCAVLGERTSRELIRSGADSAKVTAVFSSVSADVIEKIAEIGAEPDGTTLIISRSIFADGRNVCRINGSPATVGMLKQLGELLVNIHGQHDSQALLQPEKHILFIDGTADNDSIKAEYKVCFSELVRTKRELDAIYTDEDEKANRLDYLNFQIKELEDADIKIGEKEELSKKKTLFQNASKVKKCYEQCLSILSSDDSNGLCDNMKTCAELLKTASGFSDDAKETAENAAEISIAAEELLNEVRTLQDRFGFDENEMARVDERLDLIYRITHKYGGTEESAVEALKNMTDERNSINLSDEKYAQLELKLEKLSDEIKTKAAVLTKSRVDAAKIFESRVADELRFLEMPNVDFRVKIEPASYSSKGADSVEFLISANAGEEPKPIARIASGGELSRIMLAIKNVISAKDDIGTLIFDEIDSGVSGEAAQKIALKLKEVSEGRQVICVTHLASIAAHADRHLKIEKSVHDNKTFTDVSVLDFEKRKAELARIMGGANITQLQLENAHEMLVNAGIYWD